MGSWGSEDDKVERYIVYWFLVTTRSMEEGQGGLDERREEEGRDMGPSTVNTWRSYQNERGVEGQPITVTFHDHPLPSFVLFTPVL